MYVLLVKLQSIQNEVNNKKLGRFRRRVLRRIVRFSIILATFENIQYSIAIYTSI